MKGDQLSRIKILPLFLADLYEHKFINCRLINSTFMKEKEGCHLDFEEDNDFLIYLVSFLGSLSVLPGNIISALLMDKIGRIKMIGEWGWWVHGAGCGIQLCRAKDSVKVLLHLDTPMRDELTQVPMSHSRIKWSRRVKGLGVRQIICSVSLGELPAPCLPTRLFCVSMTSSFSILTFVSKPVCLSSAQHNSLAAEERPFGAVGLMHSIKINKHFPCSN